MNRLILYLLIFIGSVSVGYSQSVRTVTRLPDLLKENSGMAYYGDGIIYLITDSGNPADIYRYDTLLKTLTSKILRGVNNVDFEELARNEDGDLFIGDFGNNGHRRKDLVIYKTVNPETTTDDTLDIEKIEFSYENQKLFPPGNDRKYFDCEAMAWYGDSLYVFTKNWTDPFDGWCYMYVLPDVAGSYTAVLRDSIHIDASMKENGWITAADIRNDTLALLGSSKVHVGLDFLSKPLTDLDWESYGVGFSQKEAISFGETSEQIFISDEFYHIGNNLYFLDLSPSLNNIDDIQFSKFELKSYSNRLTIRLKTAREASVYVTDIFGIGVVSAPFIDEISFEGNDLPRGVYVIQLLLDNELFEYKWIKFE